MFFLIRKSLTSVFLHGLCWVFLFLISPAVLSQQLDPKFVYLNGSRDFSDIRTILTDSRNFLWFGCNQGLVRFNGSNYLHFKTGKNNKTISSANITALHEDAAGNIWIGTKADGVFRYSYTTDTFTHSTASGNLAVYNIQSSGDTVFLVTGKEVVYTFSNTNKLYPLPGLAAITDKGASIVKYLPGNGLGKDGWILSSDGLYRYKNRTATKAHSIAYSSDELGNPLKTLCLAKNGSIYTAAKNAGLIEFEPHTGKTTPYPFSGKKGIAYSSNNVSEIMALDDGNILLSTQDGGLSIFNSENKSFQFLSQANFPESDVFNFQASAFSTNRSYLTFAANNKGIWVCNKEDGERFKLVQIPSIYNKIPGTLYARSILALPKRQIIFIGSFFGDGLYMYDMHTKKYQSYPFIQNQTSGKTLIVNHIFRDHSGEVWLATQENGLLIFDENKKIIIPASKKYPIFSDVVFNKIYCTYEGKDNSLYIGTGGAGFWVLNSERNKIKRYHHNEREPASILSDSIFAEKFFEDSRGFIWISTTKGVTVFQPGTDKFYHYPNNSDQKGSIAKAFWYPVAEDKAGNIFIGSNDGLYKMAAGTNDLSTAKRITDEDGLLHNNVYSIEADSTGSFWITCRNGISYYNPATNAFRNFTYKNGLPARTLMSPIQYGSDGKIYHGAVESFFSFDVRTLLKEKPGQSVYFTGVAIDGRDTLSGFALNNIEQLSLAYSHKSFSFSFTAPSLLYPDAVMYSYMLEGVDENWSATGSRNFVSYTNIKPGTYHFKVKALNAEGGIMGEIRSLKIFIAAPFWQQWWFLLLLGVLALAILYIGIKVRDRSVHKRLAAKTEIEKLKTVNYQYELEIQQVVNFFTTSISSQFSVDDMLWDVTRNCISKLGFEDCVIYLLDKQQNLLVQKATWGPKAIKGNTIVNAISIPVGSGIVGSVAKNNKPEIVNNTATDNRYMVDDAARLSEIAVPISNEGEVLGVIDSEHSQANFYTQRHLQILSTIASLLAGRISKIEAEKLTRQKEIEILEMKAVNYQYQLEIEKVVSFFASAIASHQQVDDMLWDISRNLIGKLGFEDCMIYTWNNDKTVLLQRAGYGAKGAMQSEEDKAKYHVPKGKGIVGAAADLRQTILVNDTSKDKRYFTADHKIRLSELCVPIIYDNEVLGVINAEHSEGNFYTQRHIQILNTIATHCAEKIKKINAEQQAREKEVEVLKLNRDLAESQLTALRAQMNPHFIFNALNSVQQYILKGNTDEANRYLSKFSKLQREILNNSNQSFITLEKEKEILDLYLQLEQLRFDGHFTYSVTIENITDSSEIKVPPMLVQPFVENAIWHGLMPQQGERKVDIQFILQGEILECLITDNGIGREAAAQLKQKNISGYQSRGMAIVNERLEILRQQHQQPFEVTVADVLSSDNQVSGTQVSLRIYVGENV